MKSKILIGSHVSFKMPLYLEGAALESIEQGANSMMIYLGSPQASSIVPFEKIHYEEYLSKYSDKIAPENIVVHCPYIINPSNIANKSFAEEIILTLLNSMEKMNFKYLVLHPGSATDAPTSEAIESLVDLLKSVLSKTSKAHILLETMAGKGKEIGRNFEELSHIIKEVKNDRLGVCLDTCHVWESGINIKDFDGLINEINKNNLMNSIKVIHLNDSKNDIGAKKDRHENIGKGFIGFDALYKIVHCEEFKDVIKVLETPYVEGKPIYKEEISRLLL